MAFNSWIDMQITAAAQELYPSWNSAIFGCGVMWLSVIS
jgi:hypothetical protein